MSGRSKRMPGEPPPSELPPDQELPIEEGEAEIGVTEGVYFTKSKKREVWFAHDADDNPIGRVYRPNGDMWLVNAAGFGDLPTMHKSAPGGKAFLSGFYYGMRHENLSHCNGIPATPAPLNRPQANAPGDPPPGEPIHGGTDASHDADT